MARRGDDAVVVDMLELLKAKVQADLEKRAQDSGDEFGQVRARQGIVALWRLQRKLDDRTKPA